MTTPKEIKIKIKTEDGTHQKKFLEYEDFVMSVGDSTLQALVKETKDELKDIPQDCECEIVIKMLWE